MSAARLIPWVLHEFIEYIAGVFLIVAPFVFFRDMLGETAAFPLMVGVGVAVVAVQLFTPGKAGIAELLPIRVHATLDYLVAIFLILAPFLFGLTADGEPEAALLIPILLGVAHLVITLLTRFPLEEAAAPATAEAGPTSGSASTASTSATEGGAKPGSASQSGSAAGGAGKETPDSRRSASTGEAGSTGKTGSSGTDTEGNTGAGRPSDRPGPPA